MNLTPIPVPRHLACRGRLSIRTTILLLVVLPVLGGMVWYISYRAGNASAIRRLELKASKRGEPLTLAELASRYPAIPDEENAAVALLEIWKEDDPEFWQAFADGRRPLPPRASANVNPEIPIVGSRAERPSRSKALSPATQAAAEDYLKSRAAHMEKVRAALRRPRCQFPVKITDGYNALLPHLAIVKSEAQLFRLEALVATERGDTDTAITALGNAAHTGNLLTDEPFLISQLVRIACHTIALTGAQHLISRRDLALPQLDRLEAIFEKLKTSGSLRDAYIAERASALRVFNLPADGLASVGASGDESGARLTPANYNRIVKVMNLTGLAGADQRLILETYDEAIELADKDTPEALARSGEVFPEAAKKADRFPPKVFSGLLLPSLGAANRFASLEARRRAAATAVAVQKFRLDHKGALVERVEELVPQFLPSVPLDPFDGRPLRYKRLPAGFVVYSIGADGRDNDGLERPFKGNVKQFDETFIVER